MSKIEFDERLTDENGYEALRVTTNTESKTVTIYRHAYLMFDNVRRRDEIQIDRKHARWLRDTLSKLLESDE